MIGVADRAVARRPSPAGLLRVFWTGGDGVPIERMLAAGAVVWTVYSLLSLVVNGIVLDETIQPAQIIAHAVVYPPGHPHPVFYTRVFSLQNYLAAALWMLVPRAFVLSAFRNFLFLFLSAFVPFAITTRLTGRAFWGHVAAVLTLSETMITLNGVYPLWVFPDAISAGHVGLLAMLLIVALLLARQWRLGGFLLGLLPSIHLAMAIVLWPWSLCYLCSLRLARLERRRLISAVGLGLSVCALLAGAIYVRTRGLSSTPPYDVSGDAGSIRRAFLALTDVHRQPFSIATAGYFLNPVAFFAIGALALLGQSRRDNLARAHLFDTPIAWLLGLGVTTWTLVFGARVYLAAIGPLPTVVDLVMPFRFSNVTATLAIPLAVAGLAAAHRASDRNSRRAIQAVAFGLLVLEAGLLASGRVRTVNYLIFVIWGASLGALVFEYWRDNAARVVGVTMVVTLATVAIFPLHERLQGALFVAAALTVLTFLFAATRTSLVGSLAWAGDWTTAAVIAACAVAAGTALLQEKLWDRWMAIWDRNGLVVRRWDAVSDYDRSLKEWLDNRARSDEMILTPINPRIYAQPKTGHPVLMEPETLWLMTYMPSLAPAVASMSRDLYGVDYSNPEKLAAITENGRLSVESTIWSRVWETRTFAEWRQVSEKYRFRFVVAPSASALALPAVLKGPYWTLYQIDNAPSGQDQVSMSQ